ncbi:hypothetical protein EST38_g2412 [Candolleomyces aberdarensis]|uniref:Uncharacterized protein n=1 Tax=Candolleomyces aberdarensis TaxID=2316362 RepID=A0A4Q2DSY3_9AGAR|nr:hypothetical protein EST38_g2412 [Candolleomyces aberdarensis]
MTERTRAVIIDDRDRRVQYTGDWIAANGDAYNNRGRHGPVYGNTLQGSNTNGAKLTFTFTGTRAQIRGTTDPEFEDGSTDPDPNWDCVLDGRVTPAAKGPSLRPGEDSINRWPFCNFSDLIPGQHTVELIVRTKGRTFWFDDIQYTPTDVVSGETIDARQDDQDLTYSSGWESYRGLAFITRTRGSTVTFPFSA